MKILIVDDEVISRKVLFKKMELFGECTALDDPQQALSKINHAAEKKAPFDLVTLDVSMPGMDGKQVLQQIRKNELAKKIPRADQIKIIMVTSRMNTATIKACIKLGCNGYLSKPVSTSQILENLKKLGFNLLDAQMKTDQSDHTKMVAEIIQLFYKGKIELPVFPHIVKEIQECLGEESSSTEDLAKIVEKDIVIAAKLISIANSPLYKGLDMVNSLNGALLRLGMKTTQGVISAVAARSLFESSNTSLKKVLEKLWMHSFATACLGKKLGEALKLENTENLFLMGIVHDIGKMLLMKAIVDIFPETSVTDPELQLAIHEIHTTFGAALLKKLRFATVFIQVAEFHHWNTYPKGTEQQLMIISLADYLAREIGFEFTYFEDLPSESKPSPTDIGSDARGEDTDHRDEKEINIREEKLARIASLPSLKRLKLDPEKVLELCEQVKTTIKESVRVF